jgi:putative hydrolase of the HAD superfamily
MSISAVLFDLYETLVAEAHAPVRRAGSLAAHLALEEATYKREWKTRRPDIVLGRCTFRDALVQIASKLGGVVNEVVLDELHAERVAQKTTVLAAVEPDVLAALAELRRAGLKLGLVTNTFPEDVAGWERSPLRQFFDAATFSYAVGHMKPDPEIYLAACRALHVAPQHAFFVGDGRDEVAGAEDAGLAASRALWFASRLPAAIIGRGESGLWHIRDVVERALAA